jgi:DNA-directed RNA polymerase specialized sigma24 family protein
MGSIGHVSNGSPLARFLKWPSVSCRQVEESSQLAAEVVEEDFGVLDNSAGVIDIDRFVADDYQRVVSAVGRITGTSGGSAAEEAVQHALVTLIRRGQEVVHPAGSVAVLASDDELGSLRVAAIHDRAVQRPVESQLTSRTDGGDELDLEVAMSGLTLQQRQVATLHYYLGLPLDVVAQSIGIPTPVAEAQLERATNSFRFALGIETTEEPVVDEVQADADAPSDSGSPET